MQKIDGIEVAATVEVDRGHEIDTTTNRGKMIVTAGHTTVMTEEECMHSHETMNSHVTVT